MLALVVLAFGADVECTPGFLKEEFGFFVGVDGYGPRPVITMPGGYVAVGDDAAKNAVVWAYEDGERLSRILHSDVLNDLEKGDAAYTQFGIVMSGQTKNLVFIGSTF